MPPKSDKEELDSVIRNYVEEHGSISEAEVNDPETELPVYETISRYYGGLRACAEELELDVNFTAGNTEYSREELIESIKENSDGDIAPKCNEIETSHGGRSPVTRLFGGYTNAVFMAGKKPIQGWYKTSENYQDEISADYLDITRDNYWQGDPEDRWDTQPVGDGKYLNPTKAELPFSRNSSKPEKNLQLPNMRIEGGKGGDMDIETQEEIMQIVEEADKYLDIVDMIEDTNITESRVKKLLDPEADNSYGRWMSAGEDGPTVEVQENGKKVETRAENEFPDNAVAMLTSRI